MNKAALVVPAVLLLLGSAAAREGPAEQPAAALKITSPVVIDGALTEPAWNLAPEAAAYLAAPGGREPDAPVSTSVKILFDQRYLYLGFTCYDREASEIFADLTERDTDLRDDDSVYVLLEAKTIKDGYVVFMTNPRGARTDGLVSPDGALADPRWDGEWRAQGRLAEFGWSAEIAVDLTALGFEADANLQLALKLARVVPRLDTLFRQGPLDPAFTPQDLAELRPLNLQRTWKSLSGTVHLEGMSAAEGDTRPGGGLDLNYAFSPLSSASLALNPDFTDVEPDLEQVNLTPFELYLPEKRAFFQTSADFFSSGFQLFYSKRLGDLYGGAGIRGRTHRIEFLALSAFSESDPALGTEEGNTSALRLKSDFYKGLTLGLTAVYQRGGGENRGAAGMDAEIPLGRGLSIAGRFAAGHGPSAGGNSAFYLGPRFETARTHAHIVYTQIGSRFGDNVNKFGFVPDDNRREIDAALRHNFLFSGGPFESIRYASRYDVFWGMDGALRGWEIEQGLTFKLRSQWMLRARHVEGFILNEGWREALLIPGYTDYSQDYEDPIWFLYEDFRNRRTSIASGMDKGEGNRFLLEFTMGRNFGSNFHMMTMSKDFRVSNAAYGEFFFTSIIYSETMLRFPTNTIISFKGLVNATDALSFRIFFQHNRTISKLNFQAYAVYRIWPDHGRIQVGYQHGTAPFGQKGDQEHAVLLKLMYDF